MDLLEKLELGSIWKNNSRSPLIIKIVTGFFCPVYFPGWYLPDESGKKTRFFPKGELRCLSCGRRYFPDGREWHTIGYEYLLCSDVKYMGKRASTAAHLIPYHYTRIS